MNEGYNGWYNYATWKINLEFGFCDYAEEYKDYDEDMLQEYVEEALLQECTSENTMVYNYAMDFISDVYWKEIVEHIEGLDDEK
jgi:hypothetical protein